MAERARKNAIAAMSDIVVGAFASDDSGGRSAFLPLAAPSELVTDAIGDGRPTDSAAVHFQTYKRWRLTIRALAL